MSLVDGKNDDSSVFHLLGVNTLGYKLLCVPFRTQHHSVEKLSFPLFF